MAPILEMRTIDDLHKNILLQRTTTRKVTQEIDDIVKRVTTAENKHDDEYLAQAIMLREGELLNRYAAMPTLVEYRRSPGLRGVMDQGATFAVTAIIGEVLLGNIRALANIFPRAHRSLLFVMLNEIDKPTSDDGDLVDTFVRSMTIEVKDQEWPVSEQERRKLLRSMVTPLAEAMVLVAQQYKLIEHQEDGYSITQFGQRVLLHLFAAQKFIEAVSEAHSRLQQTRGPRAVTPQTTR